MRNGRLVTVLLPVYNGGLYLEKAVKSILSQTYRNFELIVIDDGSTDDTPEILKRFSSRKLSVITNQENRGLIETLNIGLEAVNGDYVARMDADDICLPGRLEKQVAFMESKPAIGVCGMQVKRIGIGWVNFASRFPLNHEEMACVLLQYPPMCHPTIMMRSSLIKKHGLKYDPEFSHAEDYDLWERASHLTRFANLPETGLFYRVHANQISNTKVLAQKVSVSKIRRRVVDRLVPDVSDDDVKLHNMIMDMDARLDLGTIQDAEAWLNRMLASNNTAGIYDDQSLKRFLAFQWLNVCHRAFRLNPALWGVYKSSILRCIKTVGLTNEIKLLVKTLRRKTYLYAQNVNLLMSG